MKTENYLVYLNLRNFEAQETQGHIETRFSAPSFKIQYLKYNKLCPRSITSYPKYVYISTMENHDLKDEIRKEFQLDRMILFSDAVFAIVITLMAIEIRLPKNSSEPFGEQMIHLIPVIIAYAASFGFIGQIWYQHLQVCGLLRDYDKGLIKRNLFMLFWIGFFPFSVTLIAEQANRFLSIIIYFIIIFLCKGAQLLLQYYILVQSPHLRVRNGVHEELIRYKKTRITVILLVIVFILVTSTMIIVDDPGLKYFAWWWFIPFPFVLKYFQKRIK